jgi:membrane-associated phospholipid phosphatase
VFLRVDAAGRTWGAAAAVIYLAFVSSYLVTHGSWPTPDILVPPLLIIALLLGRPFAFLADWVPFLALWLLWQGLAGAAGPDDVARIHVLGPLDAERRLFGVVPTVALQLAFYRPGELHWYDWTAAFIHGAHFAVPVGVAFILWTRRRSDFWRLAAGILVMSYIGLLIYRRYPAAPPWMAAERGAMGQVSIARILGETLGLFPAREPLGYAYQRFESNSVAAMPSLHAAFPLLLTLMLWRLRPRWAPMAMLYTLAMAVAVVYLGEHYVVDVLAGWAVAVASFVLVLLVEAMAALLLPLAARLPWRVPWRRRAAKAVTGPPGWWRATHGALYPGLPLVALLGLMVGPLGYRPSSQLVPPLPPPPCNETPSDELAQVASAAHGLAEAVLLFVTDTDGPTCHIADPDRLVAEPAAVRPVRLSALHRLATDESLLWDPVIPDRSLVVRRNVTLPEPDGEPPNERAYAVLIVLVDPHDPDAARDAAEQIAVDAAQAAQRSEGQ